MITISISNLESLRQNPKNFAQQLKNSVSEHKFKYSAFRYWKNAITNSLKYPNVDYLENLKIILNGKYKFIQNNPNKLDEFITKFLNFFQLYNQNGFTFIESNTKIIFPLIDDVIISGRLPIVCMNKNKGYTILYLSRDFNNDFKELKYSFSQYILSNEIYKCNLNEVSLALYSFNNNKIFHKQFNLSEVMHNIEELNSLIPELIEEIKKVD